MKIRNEDGTVREMDAAELLGAGRDDPDNFKRYLVLAAKRDRTPSEETELSQLRVVAFL